MEEMKRKNKILAASHSSSLLSGSKCAPPQMVDFSLCVYDGVAMNSVSFFFLSIAGQKENNLKNIFHLNFWTLCLMKKKNTLLHR